MSARSTVRHQEKRTLKHALGSRVALRTKAKLKRVTENHMKELEQRPEAVRSYFQDPKVKYAA